MNEKRLVMRVVLAIALIVFAAFYFKGGTRMLAIFSALIALDKPIKYYGKVIDDNNHPVANAQVYVQISKATGIKEVKILTDTQGKFNIVNVKGASLLIDKIDAQGYEYLNINRKDGHDGYENDGSININLNNPVVFTMRKKEPPTVVIPGSFGIVYENNVNLYELDLILDEYDKPYDLQRYHGDNAHGDIKTRVEYSTGDDSYTFILETPDADSGIIALDRVLYALPETGYKSPFTIKVPNNQNLATYLYIKSRGGKLYSRLDAKFKCQNNEIIFSAKTMTNPVGERNVDSDSEMYKQYLRKTDAEAKRMWPLKQ